MRENPRRRAVEREAAEDPVLLAERAGDVVAEQDRERTREERELDRYVHRADAAADLVALPRFSGKLVGEVDPVEAANVSKLGNAEEVRQPVPAASRQWPRGIAAPVRRLPDKERTRGYLSLKRSSSGTSPRAIAAIMTGGTAFPSRAHCCARDPVRT